MSLGSDKTAVQATDKSGDKDDLMSIGPDLPAPSSPANRATEDARHRCPALERPAPTRFPSTA